MNEPRLGDGHWLTQPRKAGDLRTRLTMFQAIGEHAKGDNLDFGERE